MARHTLEEIMDKFLSADPARLGRPDVPPSSDAVDEERLGGTPEELMADLIRILGEDLVRHRISDLVRYASDASPYRYIPSVIVQPKNIDHISRYFSILHPLRSPCDVPGRRDQPERPVARRRHLDRCEAALERLESRGQWIADSLQCWYHFRTY
jgi:hypothetical protein